MSTEALFRADAYLRECAARVVSVGPEGVLLSRREPKNNIGSFLSTKTTVL